MILADKIINERKKNGWSQEELAQLLGVSRQSVSKWESAQAVPDLQKILKLAEVFGVTTDYLLRDEIEAVEFSDTVYEMTDSSSKIRKVTLEEVNFFINAKKREIPGKALATFLCVICAVPLIFLLGLWMKDGIGMNAAVGGGLVSLFVMVAAAVFILNYSRRSHESG